MSRLYDPQHRSFQDEFGTRAMADRIEELACRTEFDDDSRGFIEAMDMFFLSTVDARGRPTVSYKGGDPGFVRVVDEKTLVFPSYDGNGMFLSMGNIAGAGRIGLLFMDFERPHRVRAHAHAIVSRDDPMMSQYPGADLVVRATVTDVFVNCPRYITPHTRGEVSKYVPDADGNAPLPGWKKIDVLQPFLPSRFQGLAEAEHDVITVDEYGQRLLHGDG